MNPKQTDPSDADAIRAHVRADYTRAADSPTAAPTADADTCAPGCCSGEPRDNREISRVLGYSEQELDTAPEGSNLGLGCGNPHGLASLRAGETVLDLGSGAGFDAFLAARRVGPTGRVIGVDMTPAMLERARANQRRTGADNVDFRLGEIEALPLPDASVDVVISNCVVNLSPEKARVFGEVMRVLRPGGRLAISDVVLTAALPDEVRADLSNHSACVSGAATVDELDGLLRAAGFVDIAIEPVSASREFIRDWIPGRDASEFAASASITARRPQA